MNKLIASIIIPVYNAELFLEKTIDRILDQTNDNFELILIDDGSKDRSWEICQKYVRKDTRIHAFHQENKGESSARNAGIKKAKGEYICLCDNDDYFTQERIEVIKHYYELYNPDVIRGRLCIHRDEEVIKDHKNHPYDTLLDKEYIKNEIIPYLIGIKNDESKKINSHNTICFKRELYEKFNLMYCEDLVKENDHRFLVDVISCSNSLVLTNKFEFHWVIRKGSHSSSYSPRFNNICKNFEHYKQLWDGYYDFNCQDKIRYNIEVLIECLEYVIIHKNDCNVKEGLLAILTSEESKDWFSKLNTYNNLTRNLKKYVMSGRYNKAVYYTYFSFIMKRFKNLLKKYKIF